MAIRTRLRTRFLWTQILTIGICLVLGLWGVYDYFVAIPQQEAGFERKEYAGQIVPAFEAEADQDTINLARTKVTEALDQTLDRAAAKAGVEGDFSASNPAWFLQFALLAADAVDVELGEGATVGEAEDKLVTALQASPDYPWFKDLVVVREALVLRRPGVELSDTGVTAYEKLVAWQTRLQDVSPPAAYDRPLQWLYMLCLPFVPWFGWGLWKAMRDQRTLTDEGDLVAPGRRVAAADIKDIDMSRWMSKSIAVVETARGDTVVLDDYKQADMEKIVGALAQRFHPEAWTDDARPRKDAAEGSDDAATAGDDPTGAAAAPTSAAAAPTKAGADAAEAGSDAAEGGEDGPDRSSSA